MAAWFFTRLGAAALAAWAIASLVFLLGHLASAQPEAYVNQAGMLGRQGSAAGRAAGRQAYRHRLQLDEPVFYVSRTAGPPVRWHWHGTRNQYHTWVRQLLHGQLGRSYRSGQPVAGLLREALAYTLPLMGAAVLLAVGLALLLGVYLAGTPRRQLGHQAIWLLLVGMQALPLFALALLLLELLANPDFINLLPADDLSAEPTSPAELLAAAPRLVLPLVALVLTTLPELTLPLADALRHELGQPYAVAARAKGLGLRQVLWRHALPNAVLPVLALFAGLLPALVAGVVVVEVLFALPGMGRLLAEAAAAHDLPVLTAGVLLAAAVRLLALLAADIVHYWLDPRLRASLL